MSPDNPRHFEYRGNFDAGNVRKFLGLDGASPSNFILEERVRQMGMLARAGAITSEEVDRIAERYSLGVRLGHCPEHGKTLFVKIEVKNVFVCPEPEHRLVGGGHEDLPSENRTR